MQSSTSKCNINHSLKGRLKKAKKRMRSKADAIHLQSIDQSLLLDCESPSSLIALSDLKSVLSHQTFVQLPSDKQTQLIRLLPRCDCSVTADERLRLGTKALNNEFYTKACIDWRKRLANGEFTAESQLLAKIEREKLRARTDPWKLRHYEAFWGEKLTNSTSLEAAEGSVINFKDGADICSASVSVDGMTCSTSVLVDVCQTNCLLNTSPRINCKRSANDTVCDVPFKRVTTHYDSSVGTPTVDVIKCATTQSISSFGTFTPSTISSQNTIAACAVQSATLPSFPPTLFSCFPSLGNRRLLGNSWSLSNSSLAQSVVRSAAVGVPRVILSTKTSNITATCATNSTATTTSTLFSVPVHGVCTATTLLVPSIHNCVLFPSLGSLPLIYVLNTIAQSHTAAGVSHMAGHSQANVSNTLRPVGRASGSGLGAQLVQRVGGATGSNQSGTQLVQPVGRAIDSGQSHSSTVAANLQTARNSQLFGISLPNIPILSHEYRPVGGATGFVQSLASTIGVSHVPVPNISTVSQSPWPMGGANVRGQLHAPTALSIGTSLANRNSTQLGLPIVNIPLLSRLLRPVGGAAVSVGQTSVRLVSNVGGAGVGVSQSSVSTVGSVPPLPISLTQPCRLNGESVLKQIP